MKKIKSSTLIIALCLLLIVSAVSAWHEYEDNRDGIMIHVIDVGQADCMVIETEKGNIMVDTGTDISESALRGYLKSHGFMQFSYLILSHPHDDHIGNADMILKEFEVERVIAADCTSDETVWHNFMSAFEESKLQNGTEWVKPVSGTVCHLGHLRMEVLLAPVPDNQGTNDDSLIVRMDYGECSLMLTGDAEAGEEELLLASATPEQLQADFLKVGHHGSSGSCTEEFLNAVSPRWAVISCGESNSFSHPHEELLMRLRERNIDIYRTDLNGSLRFFCDGKSFVLRSVLS